MQTIFGTRCSQNFPTFFHWVAILRLGVPWVLGEGRGFLGNIEVP